jgi:DNA-binding Xre family transcriptional regulator
MIKLQIKEAATKHGCTSGYQLMRRMNVTPSMAHRLWRGDLKMISLKTLDGLCQALNCELGDLFLREATSKRVSGRKVLRSE